MTNIRNTRQRTAVRKLLAASSEFLTAAQVHSELLNAGSRIGLATVYRSLQAMADADEVDVLRTADGEAAYRRCSRGHHHHLICRECGMAVEIAAKSIESWTEQIAEQHGFVEVEHEIELSGRCPRCLTSETS